MNRWTDSKANRIAGCTGAGVIGKSRRLGFFASHRTLRFFFVAALVLALVAPTWLHANDSKDEAEGDEDASVIDINAEDRYQFSRTEHVVKDAIKLTGFEIQVVDTDHTRLVLGPGVKGPFANDVKRLETLMDKRFPDAIAKGVDRRDAHIVIFGTTSHYERWIRCLVQAYEKRGSQFEVGQFGKTVVQRALEAPAIYFKGVASMCLADVDMPRAQRMTAHAVGYHHMNQLTRYTAPDALVGGFANVTEVMLFRTPGTTLKSGYADREVKGDTNWAAIVRQRFAAGEIESVDKLMTYSFDSMQLPRYAESWSFVSLLCLKPALFQEAVLGMRAGEKPMPTITSAFNMDRSKLLKLWHRYAKRQR